MQPGPETTVNYATSVYLGDLETTVNVHAALPVPSMALGSQILTPQKDTCR